MQSQPVRTTNCSNLSCTSVYLVLLLLGDQGHPAMVETQAFQASHPMSDQFPNMHPGNGGITTTQMQWLTQQLQEACDAHQQVIVACHHPLAAGQDGHGPPANYLAWNADEIRSILLASPCTVLVLCGHYHPGGFACEEGVHFVCMEGLLEAPSGSNAYAVIEVGEGGADGCGDGDAASAGSGAILQIVGVGSATSRKLTLRRSA